MDTPPEMSRFRTVVSIELAKAVTMNDFGLVIFSKIPGIGTDNLGSCSVIVIVSSKGAMLGHVAPRPDDSSEDDPYAGNNHVESFMDRMLSKYKKHRKALGDSSSLVICAIYKSSVALLEQQQIMERKLSDKGLSVDLTETYNVPTGNDHDDRGSVFVDATSGEIKVYVEGRVVRTITANPPLPNLNPPTATTSPLYASSRSTTSPSYSHVSPTAITSPLYASSRSTTSPSYSHVSPTAITSPVHQNVYHVANVSDSVSDVYQFSSVSDFVSDFVSDSVSDVYQFSSVSDFVSDFVSDVYQAIAVFNCFFSV
ncbi:hypothetical protein EJ05DRAFT_504535 [Pseudovirgaria hyperparasitica]|uniref:Uncharacterized protein n=1 Tax=Pseudovirgaria hyperparasitica TaxID=470096 RepID=A0A6A6VTC8_9PEZI|nr:uncharacterized protein EJ05DRAFT_504535 [Pseudovirgaria hyperparasitica]KAF2753938.1 hypothetical protein EJ05DRAFT_504535 [Pseudovirgaria hyperparasitica]